MQKQQDMGKAYWLSLSYPGSCRSPLPALQDPRSQGLMPTHSISILSKYPNFSPLVRGDNPTTPQ